MYLFLYFFVYAVQSAVFQPQSYTDFVLPLPTAWHFAVIYNNSLLIIDAIHESTIQSIQLSFGHNQWIERQQMNMSLFTNNNGHESTVSIENQLYLINVWSNLYPGRTMLRYDLVSNDIHPLPDLPIALVETCTVFNAINRIIYVIGGHAYDTTNSNYDTTQRFDTTNNMWITSGSTTPNATAYAGCSLNADSTYIYQFGGNNNSDVDVQTIEKYDITNDIWTRAKPKLTKARSRLKCRLLSTDDLIYCIGGITADNYASDIVDIFDPQSETILTPITLNTARFAFTATLWNDDQCIIICGGYNGYLDLSPHYLKSIESIGDCPLSFITTETTVFVTTQTESGINETQSSPKTASKMMIITLSLEEYVSLIKVIAVLNNTMIEHLIAVGVPYSLQTDIIEKDDGSTILTAYITWSSLDAEPINEREMERAIRDDLDGEFKDGVDVIKIDIINNIHKEPLQKSNHTLNIVFSVCAAVLCIGIGIIVWFCRRKRKQQQKYKESTHNMQKKVEATDNKTMEDNLGVDDVIEEKTAGGTVKGPKRKSNPVLKNDETDSSGEYSASSSKDSLYNMEGLEVPRAVTLGEGVQDIVSVAQDHKDEDNASGSDHDEEVNAHTVTRANHNEEVTGGTDHVHALNVDTASGPTKGRHKQEMSVDAI